MDKLLGQNLGRYHIIEPLGQGGMAAVYKAFDTTLERNVAIKIIRTDKKEGTEQDEFLKRFQREAKALAQLDHPYILKVLDYGEQDGTPYLVMPFVPGGTLKEKMGRSLPYREAAALLAPIAQALDYAHRRKVIHRDVKPANILISESGSPLLSDFGIAKILESGESTQLTATGVGIGTPDYMAPEQWMGKADARTDIYSLGIVFFQMVTGHLPFSADTPAAVLIKHMQDPLPRPSSFVHDLPEAVEQVLFKALAKAPESRFQDMGAFASVLARLAVGDQAYLSADSKDMETLLVGAPVSSTPDQAITVLSSLPAKKKKLPIWAIGLAGLAVVAVVVFLVIQLLGGNSPDSNTAARKTEPTKAAEMVETAEQNRTLEPAATSIVTTQPEIAITMEASQGNGPFTTIEGLPTDIPILTDNNGDLMKTVSQGMTMFYFTAPLSVKEVADFYLAGMAENGWEVMSETTQADMYYWVFMKGETRQVMITTSSNGETSTVSIIVEET